MLEGMGVEGMQGEGSLDILPRKENVGERAGLARLALLGEREADLGEEAFDRRRRGRAAQVLRGWGRCPRTSFSSHHFKARTTRPCSEPCSRSEVVGDTVLHQLVLVCFVSQDCC